MARVMATKLWHMLSAVALTAGALSAQTTAPGSAIGGWRLTPVPIRQVRIEDTFWSPRIQTWREVTIPDCLAKFEKDGALANFEMVRDGKLQEAHRGPPWFDGLFYQMIRAGADYLISRPDAALEKRIDGYIECIVAAGSRDPDGYLSTYTLMKEPTHRWGLNGGNDSYLHDVYNAGMLIEAGVHYYRATGKTALLKAATRLANHMAEVMGPAPRKNVIPGHSGPEEALVSLYELFSQQPGLQKTLGIPVDPSGYLKLSEFFIEARGHYEGRRKFDAYGQDHKPVFQQETIEGHAVRAVLMATGIAALAGVNDREEYRLAADRLWQNMTQRRMYLTGGVGVLREHEDFGRDYQLPHNGYGETCAAVASGFFNRNMNLLFGHARYVDELERTLYNAVLAGAALTGDHYFYENPLVGGRSRTRWSWSGCPCCPPMFLKITGALPGYIYARDGQGIYVNLFIGSRAEVPMADGKVTLRQRTHYPWQGRVELTVDPDQPREFDLQVRIPAWCQGVSGSEDLYTIEGRAVGGAAELSVNGQPIQPLEIVRGYARLHRMWKPGDRVELKMDMPVRRIKAHPKVDAASGQVALMRGPMVYCVESLDQALSVRNLVLPPQTQLVGEYRADFLGGVTVLRGSALGMFRSSEGGVTPKPTELLAIPYAANANRDPTDMAVWLPESPTDAQQWSATTIENHACASASHCSSTKGLIALNDQLDPTWDRNLPHFTWSDHCGTREWVTYEFAEAQTLSAAEVYWWEERRIRPECRLPQSWRLLYKQGDQWIPVSGASGYATKKDQFNRVTFAPVKTTALRMEVELQAHYSAGIQEWKVR